MPRIIEKKLVADRFGNRAHSYDAVTPVQRHMAGYLIDTVIQSCAPEHVRRILEIGCGTGRLTRMLKQSYPLSEITSIDISPAMVDVARMSCPDAHFIVADAEEYIHGLTEPYDLIISNAAIQWFQHPETSLPQIERLLADMGMLALSTFGNETFNELNAAFSHAYECTGQPPRKHVGELPRVRFWQELLPDSEVVEQSIRREFPNVREFLRSIQNAGATNSFEKVTYISRPVLNEMFNFYAKTFTASPSGDIYCTYHSIFIFHTRKMQ